MKVGIPFEQRAVLRISFEAYVFGVPKFRCFVAIEVLHQRWVVSQYGGAFAPRSFLIDGAPQLSTGELSSILFHHVCVF